MFFEEENRVLLSGGELGGILERNVVKGVAQMLLEDSGLANLTSACHQHDLALLQAGIYRRFHLARNVHGNGLLASDAIVRRPVDIVNIGRTIPNFRYLSAQTDTIPTAPRAIFRVTGRWRRGAPWP